MIRVHVDDELLDMETYSIFTALKMARIVRPYATVVSDTTDGPHALPRDADTDLYTGDHVAHWTHPHETGEIVETEVPRTGRVYHVQWPNGLVVPYLHTTPLIRVTKLES